MTRDTLLAAGVSLLVVGVILRGLVRGLRREQARRKQERLDSPLPLEEPDATDRLLEQALPPTAATLIGLGLLLVAAAMFRPH